jgi:ferritin-like metal-binding protein YciE
MTAEKNLDPSIVQQIQKLWSAENMLTEAMPKMIEKAQHLGLKKNLSLHFSETTQHKVALELICKQFNIDKEGSLNEDLRKVLDDGQNELAGKTDAMGLDAAIIKSAISIEHFEMKAYRALLDQAKTLGYEGVTKRIALNYEEERQAHIKLHFLQKNYVDESSELGINDHMKM